MEWVVDIPFEVSHNDLSLLKQGLIFVSVHILINLSDNPLEDPDRSHEKD